MKTKIFLQLYAVLIFLVLADCVSAQAPELAAESVKQTRFSFGVNAGYDLKPTYTNAFTYYGVTGGLKIGATLDYDIGLFGIGLDYDYYKNSPKSTIASNILSDTTSTATMLEKTDMSQGITRQFFGLGPNFNYGLGPSLNLKMYARGGYAIINGGELITTTPGPDYHVLYSGIDDKGWAFKGGLNLDFSISNNLSASVGAYYMRHLEVHSDEIFDANNLGNTGLIYGHSDFRDFAGGQALGGGNAYVVSNPPAETDPPCAGYSSIGIQAGLKYTFAPRTNNKKEICQNCSCPDDGHKVIVTVKDEISGKVIPDADVAIKDMDGNIIATGTTNSFGAVDFGEIPHDNYFVTGNIYGVETESSSIMQDEFLPDAIIRKDVLYTDLRFILKGKVVNKRSRSAEPNVVVNLTHTGNRNVQQESSDGQGNFGFPLDKNSSYEIVGVKENKLSDIKRASTIGLRRSTTLFVDLELGVENFDCGQGTVLDIKYEYDSATLLPESIFELDKLVRYMKDHSVAKIELSSHTDSRGSKDYNQDLSQRRAQSAVRHITSKGINASKITAIGYGETRLKNRCSDGVTCSEDEHRVNRRTEAILLCK